MPKFELQQLNDKKWEKVDSVTQESRRRAVIYFFQGKPIPGHMRVRLVK